MHWECSECGAQLSSERRPVVCHECGTGGAIFRAGPRANYADGEHDDLRATWLSIGIARAHQASQAEFLT
jgi:hypothetical protein